MYSFFADSFDQHIDHLTAVVDAHLAGAAHRPRLRVPVAIGVLTAALHVNADHALVLLRAYAFVHDHTLDELAGAIVGRTLDPHLLGHP